jgi:c-di-GMP-binding flagellar brake protein YcgR
MDINSEKQLQDLSPYQIHSRREIVALLRSVETHRQIINMKGNRGDAAVATSILDVDDENGLLILDCAQDDKVNQRLMDSDNISFETVLESIRILFFVNAVDMCEFNELPALMMAIPETVVRMQRRENYRVPTPTTTPVSCTITIPQSDIGPLRSVNVVLQNVSGGGVAIIDENCILDSTIGKIYENCRIDLPGGTLVVATLEIRNVQEIERPNGKKVRRMGCLFVDLPQQMLAAVQRYIAKLERDHNARTVRKPS